MIFYFEPSVEQLRNQAPQRLLPLVSEMVRADRLGFHLVVMSRSACRWISSNIVLNDFEIAQLRRIELRYTQFGRIKEVAEYYIVIDLSLNQSIKKIDNVTYVGAQYLMESRAFSETVLLVEDAETDGKFYEIVLRGICKRARMPSVSIERVNGGGTRIVTVLQQLIDRKRVLVCVYDNDKIAPMDNEKQIAKKLRAACSGDSYLGILHPTICREVENYIPLDIVANLHGCNQNQDIPKIFSAFESEENVDSEQCCWHYFDIKEGINTQRIRESGKGNEVIEWILKKYFNSVDFFGEVNIQGFGSNVTPIFLRDGKALMEFNKEMKSDYWMRHYSEKFRKLMWFFISSERTEIF